MKSKKIREEAEELQKKAFQKKEQAEKELKEMEEKLLEYNKLITEAEEEEKIKKEKILSEIIKLADDNGYFCGIILTKEDVLNIVNVSMTNHDNIKINVSLYVK